MKLDYSSVLNKAQYHNVEFGIIAKKLRTHISGSSRHFLDVGFGRGKYLDLAKDLGYTSSGIEVNREYINNASAKGYSCFHLDSIDDIKFKFDVILISHVIEHLKPEQLVDVLETYIKMLTTDGILIIASPLRGERFYYDITHIRPYYPQSIWHSFGGNLEELSFGRSRSTLQLKDIYFIRDCYRTRNFRSYYINDGLGIESAFLKLVNYTMAGLYILSGSRIGIRASWLGIYSKK
jgi:SAM-dependent methyltransferase